MKIFLPFLWFLFVITTSVPAQNKLFRSIEHNDLESFEKKLEKKPQLLNKQRGRDGYSPLMLACRRGRLPFVKVILENNGKLNLRNDEGNTALLVALQFEQLEIAGFLLKNDVDPDIKNRAGMTALMYVCKPVFEEEALQDKSDVLIRGQLIQQLLDKNCSVNTVNHKGETALEFAAVSGDFANFNMIVSHPSFSADSFTKHQINAAFRAAARGGNPAIVGTVYDLGADHNSIGPDEMTAAVLAASYGKWRVVNMLLKNGADMGYMVPEGYSAITIAVTYNKHDLVDAMFNMTDYRVEMDTESGSKIMGASILFADGKMDSILISNEVNYAEAREHVLTADSLLAEDENEQAKAFYQEAVTAMSNTILVFELKQEEYQKRIRGLRAGNAARILFGAALIIGGIVADIPIEAGFDWYDSGLEIMLTDFDVRLRVEELEVLQDTYAGFVIDLERQVAVLRKKL